MCFQCAPSGLLVVFQCIPSMQIKIGLPLGHHWLLASSSVVPVASQCTCGSNGLPVSSNYANDDLWIATEDHWVCCIMSIVLSDLTWVCLFFERIDCECWVVFHTPFMVQTICHICCADGCKLVDSKPCISQYGGAYLIAKLHLCWYQIWNIIYETDLLGPL